jgi:hypothetical protein
MPTHLQSKPFSSQPSVLMIYHPKITKQRGTTVMTKYETLVLGLVRLRQQFSDP